jgi:hypothetical protein
LAVAEMAPGMAARMDRERDLQRRLNSVDPVTRYRAKEEINTINVAQAGKIAVGIAKRTEDKYKSVIKHCDEIDRQAAERFKPLPSWAKNHIVKNDN